MDYKKQAGDGQPDQLIALHPTNMTIQELIGRSIERIRRERGMTQEQLGRALRPVLRRDWSRQAVSVAEGGGRHFQEDELFALASALGVTLGRLLTPIEDEERELAVPGGRTVSADLVRQILASHPDDSLQSVMSDARAALDALKDATNLVQSIEIQAGDERQTFLRLREAIEKGANDAGDVKQRAVAQGRRAARAQARTRGERSDQR